MSTQFIARSIRATLVAILVSQLNLTAGVLAADNTVKVSGQAVFSIPTRAGKLSAASRAAIVQHNLDNALVASKDRSPSAVKIVYVKGVPFVTLGGYQVITVDTASARAAHTTPVMLAARWANNIKSSLQDSSSINNYVSQLTGTTSSDTSSFQNSPSSLVPRATQSVPLHKGRIVFIPAGMVIPITLATGVSSEVAQSGDRVEAKVNQTINLEHGSIPAGSLVIGQVAESEAARRLGKSGELNLRFIMLRTSDGVDTPITAHMIGTISKYSQTGGDAGGTIQGETTKNKVESAAIRGAIGAGAGALIGTTIGAIASHGYGTGRGALTGAALGAGLGVADALLIRKGTNVALTSGQQLQLQLDAPAQLVGCGASNL